MAQNITTAVILGTRLSIAYQTVKELMRQLQKIESDTQAIANVRLEEIKKIKVELDKVGQEIDIIKNEITLLKSYRVN